MGTKVQINPFARCITVAWIAVVIVAAGTVSGTTRNINDVYAQDASTQRPVSAIQQLFMAGQQAFDEARYQDAINQFEAVIELNNGFAAAYYALGMVYQEISEDPRYPLWYFETAIEIDPSYAPAYDVLCRSYYQLKNYYDAEVICHKALDLNPDFLSSKMSLAWVYLVGYSDPDRALPYFDQVIEKIQNPAVYFGLGMAYAMLGENARTVDIITYLRAQGAEDFAIHLEALLRSQIDPSKLIPPAILHAQEEQRRRIQQQEEEMAAQQAQTAEATPVPVPVVLKPQLTGRPQIHIKGKIRPPQLSVSGQSTSSVKRGGQDGTHPGSFSEDEITPQNDD